MSTTPSASLTNRDSSSAPHRSHRHEPATVLAVGSLLALLALLAPAAGGQGPPNSLATSGDIESGGKLVSTTTSGPPLQVSSSVQVGGLNADLLDGLHAASFALDADLTALQNLVAAQEQLIARLHPKLVLHNGRFRAWITFVDDGVQQPAEAVPVGPDDSRGFFYFTRDFYVDEYVEILDARAVFDRWWVFAAPLTGLEYSLTVLDTETGAVKTYSSPAGSRTTIMDTNAFVDAGGFPVRAPRVEQESESALRRASSSIASCAPNAQTLCLIDSRFQIDVVFDPPGPEPPTNALVSTAFLTSHSGAFGLFTAAGVQHVVKIVEKPTFFEVNIGALTDVAYTVTVTDTCTAVVEDYTNPSGSMTNFVDASTFPNSPC